MPDIDSFENKYAFTVESQALGRIRMWRATTRRGLSALETHFLRRQNTPRDFMLCLLSVTAAAENPDNLRHRGEHMMAKQLSLLSDKELEGIAGQFLIHHTYFFEDPRRLAFESVQTEDGEGVEVKQEPLDLPRDAQESNIDYLQRLVGTHCKAQSEATESAMADLSESLSKIMVPDLSAFTGLNSQIADSLRSIRDSSMLHIPYIPDPQHTTNERLNDIADVISEFGNAAGRWEADAKRRADAAAAKDTAAAKRARFNNIVAVIALIVAIIALIITYLKS
ncbi:MAG: hypothetical protein DMF61_20980 [Blastocatellia bacterium AA13]|nr:MAG: hypothetical protein DMF61_20980 [Blastocatellia bacterium AA13]